MILRCRKCGKKDSDNEPLQLHHIIPKRMGGEDKDGRIYLCAFCHLDIHKLFNEIYRFTQKTEISKIYIATIKFLGYDHIRE